MKYVISNLLNYDRKRLLDLISVGKRLFFPLLKAVCNYLHMLQLNRGFAIEYEGSMFHNAITILHVTFITYYYFTMHL